LKKTKTKRDSDLLQNQNTKYHGLKQYDYAFAFL
jgi:hypothetical protein